MNQTKKQIEFFEGRKKSKHKKQHYVESSSEDSESECYIPKKRKAKKKIVKYKRSYNEDENDYDNVDRAVENSEESENFDEDDYDDDENEYDIDKPNKIKKQKKDLATT